MKAFKKILCTLLVVVMCLTAAPLEGFVGMEWPKLPEINFGEIKLPEIDFGEWFSNKVQAAETLTYGDFKYVINDNETIAITKYVGSNSLLVIPNQIDNMVVVKISDSVFRNCTNLVDVEIPDSIVTIGRYAFYGCTSLKSIDLHEGITTIGSLAFGNCDALQEITIPSSLINAATNGYNNGIFNGCDNLKKVIFAEGIEKIPNEVLEDASAVTEIIIPNSVLTIGSHAFYGCTSLKSIDLHEGITTIGSLAFGNCDALQEITIPSSLINAATNGYNNGIFNGCDNLKKVIFAEGIEKIPNEVLEDASAVTEVIIPNSVLTIGSHAFYGCVSLKNIIIPQSVENIDNYAFGNCASLIDVIINEGVERIGDRAFNECLVLTSIDFPTTLTSIGDYAFSGTNLTNVTILGNIVDYDRAFWGASNLTTVNFDEDVTVIPIGGFSGSGLKEIEIPSSVKNIDNYAFNNCTSLTNVILNEGTERIGDRAFNSCTTLGSVTLPEGLNLIGNYAFSGCINLSSIALPKTLIKIGNYAFSDCTNLNDIVLPNSLTTMGSYAFENCNSLTKINIPKSLTECGEYGAFSYCSNLKEIEFEEGITKIVGNLFQYCTGLESVVVPETVTEIEYDAFLDCINLESISMPDSLTFIGNQSFSNCDKLTELVWPKSLTTIDSYAFEYCDGLTKVKIPKSLVKCGEYGAFSYCSNLKEIQFEDGITKIIANLFQYCTGLETIDIPDTVIEIEHDAFYECINLKNISMPNGLVSIGEEAFRECMSLNKVVIPDTVTAIEDYSFYYCVNLKQIELSEELKTLGSYAFANCDALTEITIPKSLENCGQYGAFGYCLNLKEVEFEEGITKIVDNLFQYCSGLEDITIPHTVTEIGRDAFWNCINLSNVTLSEKLTTIGIAVFGYCEKLNNVVLPNSLKIIDNYAFENCTSLKNIIIPQSVKTIGKYAFQNCSSLEWCSIENDTISISNSVFSNCPNVYINCNEDSETIIKVIDNELNYTYINAGFKDSNEKVLDRAETSYRATSGSVSLSGSVTMIVDYAIKKSAENVVVNSIVIKIPTNGYIVENSLKLNGEYFNGYTVKNNFVTIPVSEMSGDVSFALMIPEDCYPATYARLNYKVDGTSKVETIGIVNILQSSLTLNLPKESPESMFTVSGIVAPETNVDIYVDDILVKTVTSSKRGVYTAEVEITNAKFGRQYTITAKATLKDGVKSASGKVRLLENTPELIEFVLYYEYAHTGKEKSIDLLALNGKKPSIIVYIHTPMRFIVDIKNKESVEKVYVTSNKNGDKKYIEAIYDESIGKYVAEGYFEPTNVSYVPGVLNVEYTKKDVTAEEYFDILIDLFTKDEPVDSYPDDFLTSDVEVVEERNDYFEADITLGSDFEEFENDKLKLTVETYEKDFSGDISDITESAEDFSVYYFKDTNGKEYYINFDYSDPENIAVILNDIYTGEVVKLGLEFFDDPAVINNIDLLLEYVDAAPEVVDFIIEQFAINSDHDELVKKIYATSNPEEIQEKLKAADQLKKDRQGFSFMILLFSLVPIALASTGGPVMVAAAGVYGLILAAYGIAYDLIVDWRESNILYGSIGSILGWLMDPSGFVYEATENNRLEGVTATIYYQDPETGNAIKWNAEEYDQVNPQITDDAGQYAWDVLEGMWQVKFEKEGYETTYSEWLPVPPPQLEVNIGMTTTEAPEVKDVVIAGNTATVEFTQYVDVSTVNTTNINIKVVGNTVNGTWSAVDAEEYVKDTSKLISRKFVFTANSELEGNYSISIDKVINYAGIEMKSSYNKSEKPDVHEHSYTSTTVSATCTQNGTIIYTCNCNYSYTEVIYATGHSFADGQSKCNNCDYNKADSCGCNCHKGGISKIIFKILLIFQKIFKSNKICKCGINHY